MAEELSDFIKNRRQELGLSQTELSGLTGGRLSHTTIANLEKGTDPRTRKPRFPRAVTLQILAPVLETSYTHLAELAGYIIKEDDGEYQSEKPILDDKLLTEQEKAVIRAMRESKNRSAKNG